MPPASCFGFVGHDERGRRSTTPSQRRRRRMLGIAAAFIRTRPARPVTNPIYPSAGGCRAGGMFEPDFRLRSSVIVSSVGPADICADQCRHGSRHPPRCTPRVR